MGQDEDGRKKVFFDDPKKAGKDDGNGNPKVEPDNSNKNKDSRQLKVNSDNPEKLPAEFPCRKQRLHDGGGTAGEHFTWHEESGIYQSGGIYALPGAGNNPRPEYPAEPGTGYKKTGKTGKGTFTIVDEADGEGASRWGKLKSNAGWISLDHK